MSGYDSMKDLAYDIHLDNQELRAEIARLKEDNNRLRRENCDARMNLKFMKAKLDGEKKSYWPTVVDPETGACECGECAVELESDWTFCPGCGSYIDWDRKALPETDENELYDAWRDRQLELKHGREAANVAG